jgi:hypothetical protein
MCPALLVSSKQEYRICILTDERKAGIFKLARDDGKKSGAVFTLPSRWISVLGLLKNWILCNVLIRSEISETPPTTEAAQEVEEILQLPIFSVFVDVAELKRGDISKALKGSAYAQKNR